MYTSLRRAISFPLAVAALAYSAAPAAACTGIRLQAEDGSVIYARTMEFGAKLNSSAIIIPRQFEFVGTTASGQPGLAWKSKYAATGLNGEGMNIVVDGVNEKGLAAGIFYFPGYAEYQSVTDDDAANSLAPWEVVTWALTSFATVDEVRAALAEIKVGAVAYEAWNFVPPVHYVMHDATGNSLVVEYIAGELKLWDNPVGVITNAPNFEWHLTNLRNYINLVPTNVLTSEVDGLRLSQFGQGSGMLGLPGDYTPPSRFVRAVALSQSALPGKTGEEAVRQAFHVLDAFDIPLGTVRSRDPSNTPFEVTQWTSASDTKSCSFYFHSHDNRLIRRIQLRNADVDAKEIVTFPLVSESDIQDLSGPGAGH